MKNVWSTLPSWEQFLAQNAAVNYFRERVMQDQIYADYFHVFPPYVYTPSSQILLLTACLHATHM